MPLELMAAAGAMLAVIGVVFLGRFGVAYARSEDLSVSWDRTTKWTMGLAMGLGSAVAMGLVEFGDLVAGAVEFIVSHPYFVSNVGITGLGAGALSGLVTLTTSQFVGLAVLIVGVVFILLEVDDFVA